jgi:hypothetical protein
MEIQLHSVQKRNFSPTHGVFFVAGWEEQNQLPDDPSLREGSKEKGHEDKVVA